MTLLLDHGDGTDREVELPVFGADTVRGDLIDQVSYLPPQLLRDFQQRGFEVSRDVRWETIDLGQGRRVLVPLGEFEITRTAY